jgi:hypothetical protein
MSLQMREGVCIDKCVTEPSALMRVSQNHLDTKEFLQKHVTEKTPWTGYRADLLARHHDDNGN